MNQSRSRRRHRHGPNRPPMLPGTGQELQGAVVEGSNPPIPQAPVLLTLERRCVRQVPRIALARGRQYFTAGRVADPAWTEKECVLQVTGTGGNYRVSFDFSQANEARRLPATCDCPAYVRGVLCKHLWAAILQIDRADPTKAFPESGPLKDIHSQPRPRRENPVGFRPVAPGAGGGLFPLLFLPNLSHRIGSIV